MLVKESEVMEEKNNNEYNAEMAINEYLSLLQIKYDCETVYSLLWNINFWVAKKAQTSPMTL